MVRRKVEQIYSKGRTLCRYNSCYWIIIQKETSSIPKRRHVIIYIRSVLNIYDFCASTSPRLGHQIYQFVITKNLHTFSCDSIDHQTHITNIAVIGGIAPALCILARGIARSMDSRYE